MLSCATNFDYGRWHLTAARIRSTTPLTWMAISIWSICICGVSMLTRPLLPSKQSFAEHYGVLLRETAVADFDKDVEQEVQA